MEDMTFLIDPETRDLVLDENGDFVRIYDEEAVAQNIRNTLLAWKGEWPLNLEHGTDYARIMGLKGADYDQDRAEEVIREAIFQEPMIRQIDELKLVRADRELTVSFTATLTNGKTITLEVTTG